MMVFATRRDQGEMLICPACRQAARQSEIVDAVVVNSSVFRKAGDFPPSSSVPTTDKFFGYAGKPICVFLLATRQRVPAACAGFLHLLHPKIPNSSPRPVLQGDIGRAKNVARWSGRL